MHINKKSKEINIGCKKNRVEKTKIELQKKTFAKKINFETDLG